MERKDTISWYPDIVRRQNLVQLFVMDYVCEKYFKPITIQYYIAYCVNWAPRLTLLDLGTNWTYKHALGIELICM